MAVGCLRCVSRFVFVPLLMSSAAALVLGSGLAAVALSPVQAGDGWNMYDRYGNNSYSVSYQNDLQKVLSGEAKSSALKFNTSIDGAGRFVFEMDTGSTGIVLGVGNANAKDIAYNPNKPGWVYYNSKGLLLTGYFTDQSSVTFVDTQGGTSAVSQVPILIATKGTCIDPNAGNAKNCQGTDNPETAMMGVGFDRNTMGMGVPTAPAGTSLPKWLDNAAATQASLNPFLNIVGMGDIMRRGYIVTPTGVQLGLTAANTAATNGNAFAYGQLAPLGPGQPNNWQAQPMVVTVTAPSGQTTGPQTGTVLMDTGVTDGFLEFPSLNSAGFVTDKVLSNGVTVVLDLLGAQGLVGYTFTVGTNNPQIPDGVHWGKSGDANLFNTSLHTYSGINVLYDADGGFVGIRLNGDTTGTGYLPGTNAYVTPVLVANGLLEPESALSVSLPVLLAGAATVSTSKADSTFSGDMTGPGSLTVTGSGTVTLAGSNSFTGGTVVRAGTLALTGTLTGSLTVHNGATFTTKGGYAVARGSTLTNYGTVTSSAGTALYNFGSLTNAKSGTLNANVNNAGILHNHGSIVGDVASTGSFHNDGSVSGTITTTGTVSGSGRTANLTLLPGSAVSPGGTADNPGAGIGTHVVHGALHVTPGAVYQAHLASQGQSDQVQVGGAATLDGGVVLAQLATGANIGAAYTILSAGSVSGAFDGVVTTNPLIAGALTHGSDSVTLTLQRSSLPLAIFAQTANQAAVANAADTLAYSSTLSQALVQLSGPVAAAAFDSLSGQAYATTSGVLATQSILVRNAVMDRARQPVPPAAPAAVPLAYAASAGAGPFSLESVPDEAPLASNAFWTEAFGAWGHSDGSSTAASASSDVGGFLVGVDGVFANAWRLGFAAGYSGSSIQVSSLSSATSADTVQLALYGGGRVGAVALRFGAAYGWSEMSTSRTVAVPGAASSLSADYNGQIGQVFGEIAYPVALATASVEPFAGLAYVNVHTDGFSEIGGPAALTSAGGKEAITYTSLGARGALPVTVGSLRAVVRGSLAWQHAFGDTTPESTFSFSGSQAFTVAGAPVATDAALVEAGLDIAFAPGMTLSAFYSGQLAETAQENMVKGGFTLRF